MRTYMTDLWHMYMYVAYMCHTWLLHMGR